MAHKRQYQVKFLGGEHAFDAKQLNKAVRNIAEAIADPETDEVTSEEREALRDVFGALGLVSPDDPATQMGGRTMTSTDPIGY